MVESEANQLSEEVMLGAVKFGHESMQEVIKVIINLAEEPELKNNFGKSARLVVKTKLNLNLCAKLHNEVYKETILHNDRKF